MKRINTIIESNTQPKGNNTLWIKPKEGGGKELRLGSESIGGVILNKLLQTKIVFEVPDNDVNRFFDGSSGGSFNWSFNSFEDIKALFKNFNILQSITIRTSDRSHLHNYALSYTYTEELDTHTKIEKTFTKFDLRGIGSEDDYEAAVNSKEVSIAVFVKNGEIDIEKTLNEGSVKGSTYAVRGTGN